MPSSPYKSRLFKLIVRRSNRLRDRLGIATRQARASLSLGFQIVLYPIYLLVQTARVAGTKLGQAVRQQLAPAVEPPSAPIDLLFESITDEDTPIAGIATDLENRELQVVIEGNRAIEIPDEDAREQLQRQIQTVLANYYYERRQYDRLNRGFLSLPPTFARTKIFTPLRWFWDFIRWEQTGPVAIGINLFGESALVPVRPPLLEPAAPVAPPITIDPILQALDRRLLQLENKSLAPVVPVNGSIVPREPAVLETVPETGSLETDRSRAARLYRLIYEAIDHFFGPVETSIEGVDSLSLPGTAALIRRENVSVRPRSENGLNPRQNEDPFTIARLIQAAIDHFFSPPATDSLPVANDDPWLDVTDLFASEERFPEDPPTVPVPSGLPASAPSPLPRQNTNQKISQESKPRSLQKVTPPPSRIVRKSPIPTAIAKSEETPAFQTGLSLTPPEPPRETRPTAGRTPDRYEEEPWEVQYTPLGYEKHPLERILQWLDTIILSLEEFIIRVWRRFRPRRRRARSRRGRRD
jgi:hypothetical protein